MSARVTARWVDDGVLRSDGLDALPGGFVGPLWIDVVDPDEDSLAAVGVHVSLPPLAVEDCLRPPQRPKLDSYNDLTFVIWLLPQVSSDGALATHQVGLFVSENHLVTMHHSDVPAVSRVVGRADSVLARGVAWTVHAILDAAVDEVFPVVEQLSEELEELEDLVLTEARPEYLQRLHALRRSLIALHRVVTPEREVARGLARLEVFVESDAHMYFQDVGDHLAHLDDTIDIYREVAGGVMDLFLSVQSNRMNGIMKQLTVVATIFMPLTLISGIYGMNVIDGMWPPATAVWSFGLIILVMVLIAVRMTLFFRRNDWW